MSRFPKVVRALWAKHAGTIPDEGAIVEEARSVRKPKDLPPWDLGEKHEFPATMLLRDENDELGRFMLAMATAFNDLKGLVLFEQYLLAFPRPTEDEWTASAGQWRGIHVQIHRMIAGVLHEMFVVMVDHMGLANREVRALVPKAKLPDWQKLINIAKGKGAEGRAGQAMLNSVRKKISFHYDVADLTEGYLRQFVVDAAGKPHDRSAQVSYGPDLDGTRFFYADGAAQQVLKKYGRAVGLEEPDTALVEYAKTVNGVLAPTLAAFVEQRQREHVEALAGG